MRIGILGSGLMGRRSCGVSVPQAFADARRQAGTLAKAAGMSLGPIVEITTQPRLAGFRVQDVRLGVAAASVTPSDVTIQASVQVTWRTQQGRP